MKRLFSLEVINYTNESSLIPCGYYFMSCDEDGQIEPPYLFIIKNKEIKPDLASDTGDFYPPTDFKTKREAIRFIKVNFKYSVTTVKSRKIFEIEYNDK